jgi:hypothetical protein
MPNDILIQPSTDSHYTIRLVRHFSDTFESFTPILEAISETYALIIFSFPPALLYTGKENNWNIFNEQQKSCNNQNYIYQCLLGRLFWRVSTGRVGDGGCYSLYDADLNF